MCGIAGFVSPYFSRDSFQKTIQCMIDKLEHRGPDDQGIWFDFNSGIALAHSRLSIVDLSKAGHQPMISSCRRFYIVFNGEIYNHHSLRKELPGSIKWQGHSDTETLINGISHWGLKKTLSKLCGMFAFALWDIEQKKITLVRDRLGEKPLYFGFIGETMIFSSELKSIEAFPETSLEIENKSLETYLKFGYVPAPFSIYKGIYKLSPGNFIELSMEDVKARSIPKSKEYWSLEQIINNQQTYPFSDSKDDAIDYLEFLLKDSISAQLLADVPIGAFLSGGIDSSSVVSIMQKQSRKPINTFTVGFEEFGFDESKSAKAISSFIGTNHREIIMSPNDAMNIIPHLPTIYDEPFADVSQIPTYLISKFASENVKVCLSGDGGDELFCGYSRHVVGPRIWKILKNIPINLRKVIANFIHTFPPSSWDSFYYSFEFILPKYLRINFPGLKIYKISDLINTRTLHDVYLTLISSWSYPENNIFKHNSSLGNNPFEFRNIKSIDAHHQMMYMDTLNYLPNDILVKVDRAAMASSLETRLPLLDHRIVEFAWKLPLDMKLKNNSNKWLLRQVLKKYIPNNLVDRPKSGFSVPIGKWLRGPLKSWADELLDEKLIDSQGFLSSKSIKVKWQEHLSGRQNWSKQLWTILMFQSWLKSKNNY